MKIARFIYPMLLVALGLHGLALFIPIGEVSESTPENIAVDDVEGSKSAADEVVPERLIVPDSNASTGTAQASSRNTNNVAPSKRLSVQPAPRTAPTVSTLRSAPNRPIAATSRSAPNNSQPSAPPSTPNSINSGSRSNNASAAAEMPVLPIDNTDSNSPNSLNASPNANNGTANNTAGNRAAINTTVNNPTTRVIATVSEAFKKFRDDLNQEIAYNPEHTDLEGAANRRSQWLSSINRQASAAIIETLEPTPTLTIAEIAYPIHKSKQPNRHSFKLCLDQPPHDAEIGILFDAQGTVARTPEIIRSTGYTALNNEILAEIAAYDNFPIDRGSKAYTLIVKVKYNKDECVSLPKLVLTLPPLS